MHAYLIANLRGNNFYNNIIQPIYFYYSLILVTEFTRYHVMDAPFMQAGVWCFLQPVQLDHALLLALTLADAILSAMQGQRQMSKFLICTQQQVKFHWKTLEDITHYKILGKMVNTAGKVYRKYLLNLPKFSETIVNYS